MKLLQKLIARKFLLYKAPIKVASILIVKTSSLGDIIQAMPVVQDLRCRFPEVLIDWAVEASWAPIVAAHPYVRKAIALHLKAKDRAIWKSLRVLRENRYDLVLDLQGNCKSGLVTLLSRSPVKVGFAFQSVREWPNILATNIRFNVSKKLPIRDYYQALVERYFRSSVTPSFEGVRFAISPQERERISEIIAPLSHSKKMMVCAGSYWKNKRLPVSTLGTLLCKIQTRTHATFLLVWGNAFELQECQRLAKIVGSNCVVLEHLSIPMWQNLMAEMDLVIAVDSGALHLCSTTSTPSFSIFGPTSASIFKPQGPQHIAFQGACPYGHKFDKQCPYLRSCPSGACTQNIQIEELYTNEFESWFLAPRKLAAFAYHK